MIDVYAKAPTRIDIAGGTIDMAPLSQIIENKMTVNLGVELYAEVWISSSDEFIFESVDLDLTVKANFEDIVKSAELILFSKLLKFFWDESYPVIHIKTKAQSPAGAGLGGSSCLSVAIAGALIKARELIKKPIHLDHKTFIQTIQDIETSVIKVPTGCQDYWGGYRGGLNIISYNPGGTDVETFNDSRVSDFGSRLLLVFCGKSRDSGINNWEIFKKAFDKDNQVLDHLNRIGKISSEVAAKAVAGDWDNVLRLSQEEWTVRKNLCPGIETAETKAIDKAAIDAGAIFTRICGAGGGGVMTIFVEPMHREKVSIACEAAGGTVMNAGISLFGLEVKSL